MEPRFLPLGDSAITIEFGDRIDQALVASVAALDERLSREKKAGRLAGIIETMPTYRSLTVIFDPGLLSWNSLQARVTELLSESLDGETRPANRWRLPVCYGSEYGLDLEHAAVSSGLTRAEVVELHVSQTYTVYMIGFLPGFPFMGDVVSALHMPRLREPRTRVPAGSVAITGQQTAIYPWESPGGWNIIGRCPLPLFDAHRPQPALLGTGDLVNFEIVSPDRYEELASAVREHALDFGQFRLQGESI
ncbi:5-oxoprolinase subunit PxpB [Geobacter argillaceus]|uniref:KipI family sensor histidine kinase inhibitor n=1 Tax=Geobacter argillaceus TaxID=345631 RepID=A0A562VNH5_9BACT|nr:5-oxoprolinase subunit PxpB [Geobacter argillaceus]TWJ19352.1 KipI family sensor histidine kinase inhibitor [Geobacter argillaceus]